MTRPAPKWAPLWGKVVNITKFGAFVNILPGRDGLVHISKLSKLAQGKRVERVEDVLSLGEELEVHVDDIDPVGKVSLSLEEGTGTAEGPDGSPAANPATNGGDGAGDEGHYETVSFEDTWEQEARSTFGDLGPGTGAADQPAGSAAGSRGGGKGAPSKEARPGRDATHAVAIEYLRENRLCEKTGERRMPFTRIAWTTLGERAAIASAGSPVLSSLVLSSLVLLSLFFPGR